MNVVLNSRALQCEDASTPNGVPLSPVIGSADTFGRLDPAIRANGPYGD